MRYPSIVHVIVITVTCLALSGPARSQVRYSVAALTGQPAPGAGGTTYSNLRSPLLNDAGQVAFRAELANSDRPFDWGIFSGSPGAMQLLARSGDAASGVPTDFTYGTRPTDPYALTGSGTVLYSASLSQSGTYPEGWGLWVATGTHAQVVCSQTVIAPGMDPYFDNLVGATMRGSGVVAITAELGGPTVDHTNYMGIWAGPVGNLQPVARMGEQAVGAPIGITYADYESGVAFGIPALSDAGLVAFGGRTANPQPGQFPHSAAWAGQPGALHLLAREGDPAPQLPGETFGGVGSPAVARSGQLAFVASLGASQIVIYAGTADNLYVAVRTGQTPPGFADAAFDYLSPPVVNSAGHLAFTASISASGGGDRAGGGVGLPEWGIWTGTDHALRLVALQNGPAPDTTPGATFWSLNDPLINDLGQIAFGAYLSDLNAAGQHTAAIYLFDPSGGLQMILRDNELIDIGGQWRTIRGIDTGSLALNNSGQLAFLATFDDGSSGVLIATIPEPAASLLLGLLAPYLLARRSGGKPNNRRAAHY
ncbi:MAG: hypothetical protein NTU53_23860 [Planctomycetota bacterium]|nr:hypothetical protein [Planctomycetota bacterium]